MNSKKPAWLNSQFIKAFRKTQRPCNLITQGEVMNIETEKGGGGGWGKENLIACNPSPHTPKEQTRNFS